jgi:hypothetical protein
MDDEVCAFLLRHLKAVEENDITAYRETTAAELSLYEWWVTPHRIEGLSFHEFMMDANTQRGTVFGSESPGKAETRFDLANLSIQRYGDSAVASYTLLVSTSLPEGVRVVSHNETRVIVRQDGKWKVVHVHKSPAWPAPHVQPQ